MYLKITPQELQDILSFIDKTKKYLKNDSYVEELKKSLSSTIFDFVYDAKVNKHNVYLNENNYVLNKYTFRWVSAIGFIILVDGYNKQTKEKFIDKDVTNYTLFKKSLIIDNYENIINNIGYSITFSYTGIGIQKEITCLNIGITQNVTDYSNW